MDCERESRDSVLSVCLDDEDDEFPFCEEKFERLETFVIFLHLLFRN